MQTSLDQTAGKKSKILISGGHGFLGKALAERLKEEGYSVSVLTRRRRDPNDIEWNPETQEIESEKLDGFYAVVHLAGESLTSGRWTAVRKASFRKSRVDATAFLISELEKVNTPPSVFFSSSGIGFYGNSGDDLRVEADEAGSGYLAELCIDWEKAAEGARAFAKRIVKLRTGIVLSPDAGALKMMLPVFRKGLGGKIGNGRMWMSWISVCDWVSAVSCLIESKVDGPVNLCAPIPVPNSEFTSALGKALSRPTFAPVPTIVLKVMYGSEMAKETVLSSCRVEPKRLQEAGFKFKYPNIEDALRFLL